MKKFTELGLSENTLSILRKKGFEEPTPIQEKMIPFLLQKQKDVIAQAETGTGKTAAFGLPLCEIIKSSKGFVQVLILTPTRELAIQVSEEIHSFFYNKKISVIPIYGGQSISLQLRHLKKGVDVVVGTPGRVIDHLNRKTLKLDKINYLILDEADEMLNMGFEEEVKEILMTTNSQKRVMLFSATMPKPIVKIAEKYMGDYEMIKVTQNTLTASQTDQIYFEVSENDKFEALCRIIDMEEDFYGLIFCRTKKDVDTISAHLSDRGYDSDCLHGDISQALREKILTKFKRKQINILVATDVAARGIDVKDISHVINYAIPHDPESYVHRIGRTGRAGKEGNAITFITPQEYRKLQFIQKTVQTDIRKEKLPKVKDLIKAKKNRIKNLIGDILKEEIKPEYRQLSEELLQDKNSDDLLSALLQLSFQDELDEKSYAKIALPVEAMKGTTRLFVNQGRKDGLTRRNLEKIITGKCKLDRKRIKDIYIQEKFSFITLPFYEAEIVLSYFKEKRGRGPVIVKAKKTRN